MAITPTQERYVDPFADIYSDKVDRRLMAIYPSGKGLIYGLHLQEDVSNPSNLIITSGICLKDFVTLNFINDENYDLSTLTDGHYYVIVKYDYVKTSPPPEAEYDVVDASLVGDYIILGEIDVSGGQLVSGSISYNNRTKHALLYVLDQVLGGGELTSGIDMNNNKIINLGVDKFSITDPLDGTNKEYVDDVAASMPDEKVKVDTDDGYPGYLDDKVIVGENLTKEVLDDNFSSPDPGNNHILYLSGIDDKISIISGDSRGVFTRRKFHD